MHIQWLCYLCQYEKYQALQSAQQTSQYATSLLEVLAIWSTEIARQLLKANRHPNSTAINTNSRVNSLHTHTRTRTRPHPFNGPLSGTTLVSPYQKGKTNLDFTEARDSEWQRNLLCHMQVCTLLQTNNHASILLLSFYRPDALPAANQQCQSTEGKQPTHCHEYQSQLVISYE